MTITFYNTDSPKNKIGKNKTTIVALSGVLRDPTDKETPTMRIDTSSLSGAMVTSLMNANYAHIDSFDRYYFINNKTPETNKLISFDMESDPLDSFAAELMIQNCLLDRTQYNGSQYIIDNMRPSYNFPMVLTKKFPYSLDQLKFYLTVATSSEGTGE